MFKKLMMIFLLVTSLLLIVFSNTCGAAQSNSQQKYRDLLIEDLVINLMREKTISSSASMEQLKDSDPEYAKTIQFGFAETLRWLGLNFRTPELALVATDAILGNAAQIPFHLVSALNLDAKKGEIIELISEGIISTGFSLATSTMWVANEIISFY